MFSKMYRKSPRLLELLLALGPRSGQLNIRKDKPSALRCTWAHRILNKVPRDRWQRVLLSLLPREPGQVCLVFFLYRTLGYRWMWYCRCPVVQLVKSFEKSQKTCLCFRISYRLSGCFSSSLESWKITPLHISGVRSSILSTLLAFLVSAWVSLEISGFLPSPENVLLGEMVLPGCSYWRWKNEWIKSACPERALQKRHLKSYLHCPVSMTDSIVFCSFTGFWAFHGAGLAGSRKMSPKVLSALPKGRLHQHTHPFW